jgi:multiple sugar transport system substrate-binding protein
MNPLIQRLPAPLRALVGVASFFSYTILSGQSVALAAQAAAQPSNTLVVASFPSFDDAVKVAIPLYKKVRPDVTIKLNSLSFDDHHSSLVTALSTGTGMPDVMGIEAGFLGKFVESGGLQDLSQAPYNALKHRERIVKFTTAQAMTRSGALIAMPADLGPGSLFYRHDILQKAGVQPEQLTQSWESYISAGKQIKQKTGAFLLPNAGSIFQVYIRSNLKDGEGVFFDKDNKILVTQPRFAQAFKLAKEVRANKLDAKIASWTNEWNEGFKRGLFASEMSGAWLAGHLSNYIAPASKGLWRAAYLPEGAFASWGGSFYAIPKRLPEAKKKLAWDFIEFMATNREIQLRAFKELNAYPALVEVTNDPFFGQPIEYLGGQPARQLWRISSEKIPAITVNRLDAIAGEIVSGELAKVLELDKDITKALSDAERQIARRMRKPMKPV